MKTHNPFRTRTPHDKLRVWVNNSGAPLRFHCTRTFRTEDGLLGLERVFPDGGSIATTPTSSIIDSVILIEPLKP